MEYIIGSKLLNLDNTKDNDVLVISSKYEYNRFKVNGNDCLFRSEQNIKDHLSFNVFMPEAYSKLIYNYQLDADIIGQDFPIEYHLLDYKDKVIELLNYIVDNKLLNFNPLISVRRNNCSKLVYHIAYNTFIIQNNSTMITEEQKAIIQKLHNGEMPRAYLSELKAIIKRLK